MKNNKLYRTWRILTVSFIMFIRVYWAEWTKQSDEQKDVMWGKLGKRFKKTLFDLEGPLIKVGQMLSIRSDLLPAPFIAELQDLTDQVPSSPWNEIEKVLHHEWGADWHVHFQDIQTPAIASASIGEVYKGTLQDGTGVAIKVLRPSIESIMKTDFRALEIVMFFVRYLAPIPKGFIDFRLLFQEVKEVIGRELDFEQEFRTGEHFKARFAHLSFLKIPTFYKALSTRRVLVMEWVDGERVTDFAFLDANQIDRQQVVERLAEIFLPQWIEPGILHADPHAGNIRIQQDGTIVLLDFGMIGEVSKQDSVIIQEFLLAVYSKDIAAGVRALDRLGFIRQGADLKEVEQIAAQLIAIDFSKFQEMSVVAMKAEINSLVRSLPIQVPIRFVFLGRAIATMEGMLRTLRPDQDLYELIKPTLFEWVREHPTEVGSLLVRWMKDQVLLQVFSNVYEWIKAPERARELSVRLQRQHETFLRLENRKQRAFWLGSLGLIGLAVQTYVPNQTILITSSAVLLMSVAIYAWTSIKNRQKS